MQRHIRAIALLALMYLLPGKVCLAGEYNPVLKIGDAAPAWTNLPGIDGKQHSLGDLKEQSLVVLVFTCNSCPVATDYEDRIIALAHKFASSKVAFVAINVNKIEADGLERMKERAASHDWPYPYLFDETQKTAKDYGATFTPEFYILDSARRVAYMGGLDDNSSEKVATKPYLSQAIEALLAGKKADPAETAAIGCQIRYARRRRN